MQHMMKLEQGLTKLFACSQTIQINPLRHRKRDAQVEYLSELCHAVIRLTATTDVRSIVNGFVFIGEQ